MYATADDMVARFGATEMVRLTRPKDRTALTPDEARMGTALRDAGALIDDYLRKLYTVPLASPPASIVRAACVLARHDLAQGDAADPTEEMRLSRKEVVDWLRAISSGAVQLDAPGVSGGLPVSTGGARVSDRPRAFGSFDGFGGW